MEIDGGIMDESMILGRFFETLLRGWLVIVLVVVACVGGAAVYTYSLPVRYRARALVATVRETTRVTLGTEMVTLSEDEILRSTSTAKERLQSFVAFVKNPTIADQVVKDLGDRLPAEMRTVGRLLPLVDGRLATGSDAIEITVSARNANDAATVANAWAAAYVSQLNALYGSYEEGTVGAIGDETAAAEAAYRQRQAEVEAYLAADRRDELSRTVADLGHLLDTLSSAGRVASYGALSYQQRAYLDTVDALAEAQQDRLTAAIDALAAVDEYLRAARGLLEQVQSGGDPSARSSETAVMLLKAQAFAGQVGTPDARNARASVSLVLEAGAGTVTAEAMTADLRALVQTLEARHSALTQELTELAQGKLAGEDTLLLDVDISQPLANALPGEDVTPLQEAIAGYQEQLNAARTELAQEGRRLLELEAQRDLSWQSYQALSRHQAELSITDEATGARVRLAVPATPPQAVSRAVARNLGVAAVAGLLLGVIAAWLMDFWRNYRQAVADRARAV
ncbi:MAG: hypothetical protein GX557_02215 [Chloroflexi bacterium]|nr:hypothetical protein [Chloroflexota bacterium]